MSAGLISYNAFFVLGFINYLLAVGMALAAAGLWIRLAGQRFALRALIGAACACIPFFVHAFGVALFGVLVGSVELQWLLARRPWRRDALRAALPPAILLAVSFIGPVALWHLTPRTPLNARWGWSILHKLMFLTWPFASYSTPIAMASAILFLLLLATLIADVKMTVAPGAKLAFFFIAVLFVVTDFAQAGGEFVDARIPLTFVALLCAGLLPRSPDRRAYRRPIAVTSMIFLLTWWAAASVWIAPNTEADQLQASIAAIPPGSRVVVGMADEDPRLPYWRDSSPRIRAATGMRIEYHLPALLVIERRAFWPLLFSDPSQHPIIVAKAYRALAGAGVPPDPASLLAQRSDDPHGRAPYLQDWPAHFDYLLIIDAGGARHLGHFMAGRLTLLNRSPFCALFRINHDAAKPPGHG